MSADAETLYEQLMEARQLLWDAAVLIRLLDRKPEPQAEVETSNGMDMQVVHWILEQP